MPLDTLEISWQETGEELPSRECWEWHSRSCEEALRVVDLVAAAMAETGYPPPDRFAVKLVLDEAITNAVRHGNRGDPGKLVRVRVHVDADRVLAEVEDEGQGFDPEGVPDPREQQGVERPGGRGVFLMRSYATWVRYNEQGNRVTLCRRRSGGG